MKHLYMLYFLLSLALGGFLSGMLCFVYSKTKLRELKVFAGFYAPLTATVLVDAASLYLAINASSFLSASMVLAFDMFEIIMLYLLAAMLPIFTHVLVAVPHAQRDNLIVSLAAALGLGLSLAGLWSERFPGLSAIGWYSLDFGLLGAAIYSFVRGLIGYQFLAQSFNKRMATIFFWWLGLSLPIFIEETVVGYFPFLLYPLVYWGLSLAFGWLLISEGYLHSDLGGSSDHSSHRSTGPVNAGPDPAEMLAAGTDAHADLVRNSDAMFEFSRLSAREKEVLHLVMQGYSNLRISETLFISVSTVKAHLGNIYKKLGLAGRYELITRFAHVLPSAPSSQDDTDD